MLLTLLYDGINRVETQTPGGDIAGRIRAIDGRGREWKGGRTVNDDGLSPLAYDKRARQTSPSHFRDAWYAATIAERIKDMISSDQPDDPVPFQLLHHVISTSLITSSTPRFFNTPCICLSDSEPE